MTPSVATAASGSNPEVFPNGHLKIEGRKGFKIPPLDGSLNYLEMVDWHTQNNPDWVWSKYRKSGSNNEVVEITFKQLSVIVQRVTRYVAEHFAPHLDVDAGQYLPIFKDVHGRPSRPVIGIVANMDTLSYFCLLHALMRAGLAPFCISINNSREAIAHLLKTSGSSAVLRGSRGTTPDLDAALDGALNDLGAGAPQAVIQWPSFSLLYNPTQEEQQRYGKPVPTLPEITSTEQTMVTLHSSGSTSFPKAIPMPQRSLLAYSRLFWYGDVNISGAEQYIGHLPAWHAFALFCGNFTPLGIGATNILREPTDPPKPVSPPELLDELAFWKPTIFLAVPMLYQAWARDPKAVKILSEVGYCINGTGPIDPEVAWYLQREGVKIKNAMGATETVLSVMFNADTDPLRMELPDKFINILLRPQPDGQGDDIFEILVGENDWYAPNVFNEEIDGQRYYATKDLIRVLPKAKPTDRTYFHVVGRLDDQIMHSTGEKTNPGPLVHHIQSSPLVRSAVYFGRQRNHVGALVEPAPGHEIDPTNDAALAEYRNAIWPAVEKANSFAPSHSLLFKEMIVVADKARPFPRTAKGSVRSGVALDIYKVEIEKAYEDFENIGQSTVQPPQKWDQGTAAQFVRDVIADALGRKSEVAAAEGQTDIFALGVNSLNATKIRNVFAAAVRDATPRLEPAFVYANPTIDGLAAALLAAKRGELATGKNGAATGGADVVKQHLAAMQGMLDKYATDWPKRTATNGHANGNSSAAHGEVALVTGTTGGLGAHLLDLLVADPSITRIFAVNRANKHSSLLERQREALTRRGLSPEIASHAKVTLVEADLTKPQLSLSTDVYARLRDETTFIVHNGWQLNFNLSLTSFEPHVQGTRSLIDLSLASPHSTPPAIIFTSSIAAVSSPPPHVTGPTPEEEFDLQCSVGPTGYGESKAVAEHLLAKAAREAGVPVANVRIGQLSGSTTNGAWAITDWLPLIVRSGQDLGCLPSIPRTAGSGGGVSWIPTDVAAKTLLEFRGALTKASTAASNGHANGATSSTTPHVFHIVHPRLSSWDEIFTHLTRTLSTPQRAITLVPFVEWAHKLEEAGKAAGASGPEKIPTLKLLDFFLGAARGMEAQQQGGGKEKGDEEGAYEAMGSRRLDTTKAQSVSETLRSYAPLDVEGHVRGWVRYWREEGFLQ